MSNLDQAYEVFENLIEASKKETLGEKIQAVPAAQSFCNTNAAGIIDMMTAEQIKQRAHTFGLRFKSAAIR